MRKKPVIANNTPLVSLWELNSLFLLRELYTEVWIPQAVEDEFLATNEGLIGAIKPLLTTLHDNGLYLSVPLTNKALQLAGET